MKYRFLKDTQYRNSSWINDRSFARKGDVVELKSNLGEGLKSQGYVEVYTEKPTPSQNKSFTPQRNKGEGWLGEKKKGGWYDVYNAEGEVVATKREDEANKILQELNANV